MQIKTKGIILKELASGDEDKLLTILTEDRGVIFAYARGARRFKNRLAFVLFVNGFVLESGSLFVGLC
mgnify:CR=1 FL=1